MISWVDDDPCDCCGSPYHLFHDCPVARRRIEAYREQQDRIVFGFENHEGSLLSSSYHQPLSSNSYCYYQSNAVCQGSSNFRGNLQYQNRQEENRRNYERETYNQVYQQGSQANYQENWQDQGNQQEGLAYSDASMKDTLMEFMKEIRQKNKIRDKIYTDLVQQVTQLAEGVAELKAIRNNSTSSLSTTKDVTIELELVNDDVVDEGMILPNEEVGEEVVEINVEESHVDQVVMKEALEEEFTSLKEYVTSCVQPLAYTPLEEPVNKVTSVFFNHPPSIMAQFNKVGDDGLNGKKRKVSWEDLGQIIMKWPFNDPTDVSMLGRKVKIQHVNYRTYIGNSVGKCGFQFSRTESMDMMGKKDSIESQIVNYHAYIGNSVGKCSLRPP